MKKFLAVCMTLALVIGAVGCGKKQEIKNKKELVVFAAASMTETLEKVKKIFEDKYPDIKLSYTFDSSGTLKTQIKEGANADVFISASKKQMNALDKTKGEVKNDNIIDTSTRIDLLENKVTLVVPKGSNKEIKHFSDFATDKVGKIAIGNSDVPVGQYSEELLKNLGVWEKIQNKISFGSNVKEVTTWVSEGAVDAGIVYKTDAFSAGLKVMFEEDGKLLKTKVIYPAAVLNKSKHKEDAKKYLKFLQGSEAKKIFENVGFTVVK